MNLACNMLVNEHCSLSNQFIKLKRAHWSSSSYSFLSMYKSAFISYVTHISDTLSIIERPRVSNANFFNDTANNYCYMTSRKVENFR